jgi:hypothetical protein
VKVVGQEVLDLLMAVVFQPLDKVLMLGILIAFSLLLEVTNKADNRCEGR